MKNKVTFFPIIGICAALFFHFLEIARAAEPVSQNEQTVTNTPADPTTARFLKEREINRKFGHNQHPDAQWFPDAGLGLFLHWDQSSVRAIGISNIIHGGVLRRQKTKLSPEECARIVREKDYNLTGKPVITPNEYWGLAKEFNPTNYHPEVWLKKAKDAGFNYAVMTVKHHGGFCMWPSAFGEFNTKNSGMKGRDLVKEYVEACRSAGLKVGIYFSGPDYYLDRDYHAFVANLFTGLDKDYPGQFPDLDLDLNPRPRVIHTPEQLAAHKEYLIKMIRGQLEELLTHYGKIDVLWLDGTPQSGGDTSDKVMPFGRIRELQPGIIVTDRFHHYGDFTSVEIGMPQPENTRLEASEWGEFCDVWAAHWSYTGHSYRPLGLLLSRMARTHAMGFNYLVDVGPMASGDLDDGAHENIAKLGDWMKVNGEAIHGTRALQGTEKANVPAVSKGDVRYLYLVPAIRGENDYRMPVKGDSNNSPSSASITGLIGDYKAQLLGGETLPVTRDGNTLIVEIPSGVPGETVRVVKLSPKF
jgi:alpha-L-fucosidase